MANELRALTVLLALSLLSTITAVGQINTNMGRKVTPNGTPAKRSAQTPPSSRRQPPKSAGSLPFEQTVIIYYSTGQDAPKVSSAPRLGDSRVRSRMIGSSQSGPDQTATGRVSNPQHAAPSTAAGQDAALQPILIYYKTFRSIPAAGGMIAPSIPNNEEAAPTALRETKARSNEVASISSRISELHQPLSAPAGASKEGDSPSLDGASKASNVSSAGHRPADAPEAGPILSAPEVNPNAAVPVDPEPVGPRAARKEDTSPESSASSPVVTDLMTAPAISSPRSTPEDIAASKSSIPLADSTAVDLETASLDAVTLNNSAVQLTLEHQYTEARTLLQRAIDAHPEVAKFHRNLSIVYERMKMTDEALASAHTAEKLSPNDPSVVEQRCALEFAAGNSKTALACYKRLNSIQPLDGLSQTYFGIALFRSGKVDESIAILEQAANSKPPVPFAINALGIAYYESKRFKQAAAAFKTAVEVAPEMFELRYNLAVTQLLLRNKAGAVSQYNILKAGNPELAARLYRMLFSDKIVVVPEN